MNKPSNLPNNPKFSTGPTSKRPSYSLSNLSEKLLGRSHRSADASHLLQDIVNNFKELLKVPKNYKLILTPGSDTGAIELALWNLIGPKPVDCIAWEAFGYLWAEDLQDQLKIKDLRIFKAPYGDYPDIKEVDFKNNDVIFTHCGTTSGITFQNIDSIPADRKGLIISDATSYVLSEDISWDKIDVLTFSWQKCLGGEAQTGMLVLSPRAIERINTYTPSWPIPHIFRIKDNGKIREDLLDTGSPLNTISLLSCIDIMDALEWVKKAGGAEFCYKHIDKNFKVIKNWVENSSWVSYLSNIPEYTCKTSVCFKITNTSFLSKSQEEQKVLLNNMFHYLETNHIAYDILPYRLAPAGLRIWCGVTVNDQDLFLLTQWIEWYLNEHCQ